MKPLPILTSLYANLTPAPYPLNLDALSLSRCLQDGTLSAVDVMEATLDRIETINPKLGPIIAMKDRQTLLQLALEADQSERKGWLHGIPIAIKDLSDVKGFPTSNGGSPLSSEEPVTESDPFVQRLIDAGAIVIGKTNSPESGLGSHTYNARWGITRNPYNPSLSAGGSSGGAAVAVATHMLAVSDGSDMMGSLRNPAGWNHVYSFRPTAGLLEYDDQCPVNPLEYPISTIGPMARTVQDLAAYLTTLVGNTEPYNSCCDPVESPYRVGWLGDWEGAYPMESGIVDLCRQALQEADDSGSKITVQDTSKSIFPAHDLWKSWTTIRSAIVCHTELSKHGQEALLGESSKIREELQWEVRRGLQIGTTELDEAKQIANEWSCVVENILQEFDVLALPSAQVWPFPVEWRHPDRIGSTDMDTYHRWMEVVVPASLAGLPVATIPAGFSDLGLPMGIQLIGRRHQDEKLLKIASRFQDCFRQTVISV